MIPFAKHTQAAIKRIFGKNTLSSIMDIRKRMIFCNTFGYHYASMSLFKTIDGFLSDKEAVALCRLTQSLPHKEPIVVEIGSWVGKSSVIFGRALRKKQNPKLYCIDPFDISQEDAPAQARYNKSIETFSKNLEETFRSNIARAKLNNIVTVYKGYSHKLVTSWNDKKINLLFIDGNHLYDNVKRDFTDWSRFIPAGGYVAFHDALFNKPAPQFKYYDGPKKVIEEMILSDRCWEKVTYIDSLFIARRKI